MAGLNAHGLQSRLLITPLSECNSEKGTEVQTLGAVVMACLLISIRS